MAITLVETYTVGSGGVVNFTFSNIPQTGTDLMILWQARSETTNMNIDFIPNKTGYSGGENQILGTGTIAQSSTSFKPRMPPSSASANSYGNSMVVFPNYTASGTKLGVHEVTTSNNGSSGNIQMGRMTQDTTAAITAVFIRGNGGQDIEQNSVFSLYIIS